MNTHRSGSSLLEAIVAVALLGIMVLSTVPIIHAARAASTRAIAVIETAVLAEYLASAIHPRSREMDMARGVLSVGGDFDPPFQDFHWRLETDDDRSSVQSGILTVFSSNAATRVAIREQAP